MGERRGHRRAPQVVVVRLQECLLRFTGVKWDILQAGDTKEGLNLRALHQNLFWAGRNSFPNYVLWLQGFWSEPWSALIQTCGRAPQNFRTSSLQIYVGLFGAVLTVNSVYDFQSWVWLNVLRGERLAIQWGQARTAQIPRYVKTI